MKDAAFVAHMFPGLGDPMRMTIDVFDDYLNQVPDILKAIHGRGD